MVDSVRPCLGLEGERTAMSYDTSVLAGITAVEEIAAVELQAALVGENIHYAARLRLRQTGDLADSAT